MIAKTFRIAVVAAAMAMGTAAYAESGAGKGASSAGVDRQGQVAGTGSTAGLTKTEVRSQRRYQRSKASRMTNGKMMSRKSGMKSRTSRNRGPAKTMQQ